MSCVETTGTRASRRRGSKSEPTLMVSRSSDNRLAEGRDGIGTPDGSADAQAIIRISAARLHGVFIEALVATTCQMRLS